MLSISCKRASELTEKKLHGELSLRERFALWFHQKICPPCTKYDDQSEFIDKGIERLCREEISEQHDVDALKKRINEEINK